MIRVWKTKTDEPGKKKKLNTFSFPTSHRMSDFLDAADDLEAAQTAEGYADGER